MKRNRSEEWERPKSDLARSLLEDTIRLSPIAETSKPDLCTTDSSVTKAPSSPNLIIEIEKNRHDESDGFYKGLEARMNKLHKKLFCESEDDSNGESDEFYKGLEARMIKLRKKLFYESEDDSNEETYKLLKSVDNCNDSGVLEEDVCDERISQYNITVDSSSNDSEYQTFASELNETLLIEREILSESPEHNGMVKTDSSTSITHKSITTQAIEYQGFANNDIEDSNNDFIEYQRVSSPISTKRNIILNHPPKKNVFVSSKLDLHRKQADYASLVVKQANIYQASEVEDGVEVMRQAARKIKILSPIPKEMTSIKDTESWSSIIASSSETDIYSSSSKCNILNKTIYSLNTENPAVKRKCASSSVFEEPPNKRKRYERASIKTDPMIGKK